MENERKRMEERERKRERERERERDIQKQVCRKRYVDGVVDRHNK